MRARVVVADSGDDGRRVCACEGLERLTPATTYVFVSNHQSIYDIPVIFASLPFQLRIIAKESLGTLSVSRLASHPRGTSAGRSPESRPFGHPEALAASRERSPVADYFS